LEQAFYDHLKKYGLKKLIVLIKRFSFLSPVLIN
jgi:hypothetical protein